MGRNKFRYVSYSKFTVPYTTAAREWFRDNLGIEISDKEVRKAALRVYPNEHLPEIDRLRLTFKGMKGKDLVSAKGWTFPIPAELYDRISKIRKKTMPHAPTRFFIDTAIILYVEKLYDLQGKPL